MKQTARKDFMNVDNVKNDPARELRDTIQTREDNIKNPTKSKLLTKTRPRAGAAGSLVRFLWSPGTKKSLCLIRGTICRRLNSSNTSWKETWS